jgi:YHYH protein
VERITIETRRFGAGRPATSPRLRIAWVAGGVVLAVLLSGVRAARAGTPACPGDCQGDGRVSADELVKGVRIALGQEAVGSCRELDADGSGEVTVDELTFAVLSALRGCSEAPPILSAWILNQGGERSQHVFEDASRSLGVLVDVESVSLVTDGESGEDLVAVRTSGIPSYRWTLSEQEIDELDSRPRAASDFRAGRTTAVAAEPIEFGRDIGYRSASRNCDTTGGSGYWPPGPECPIDAGKEGYFPVDPQPNESGTRCETDLGAIGYWLNGVSIFDWYDGQSYLGQRVWQNLAPRFELYDLDICAGHAANGEYHHHSHPQCLAIALGDDGREHSPLYGYVADGYPIYGPWEADGVLAKSSWVERDYDDPSSPTGCGAAGGRTCLLADPYDVGRGTTAAPSNGPKTTDIVETLSRNEIVAASGVYFQDYYHDPALTVLGGEYLDEHNGHSDALRGYHYHVTAKRNAETGDLEYAFPGTAGPSYYGVLHENAVGRCRRTNGPGPGEDSH